MDGAASARSLPTTPVSAPRPPPRPPSRDIPTQPKQRRHSAGGRRGVFPAVEVGNEPLLVARAFAKERRQTRD
eukprot:SAG11_NODE_19353_length_468_cov_1.531165_1_plen_72_part_01